MTAPPSTLQIRGGLVLLSLVWGSTYLVIRQGLEHLPPFGSAALRFLIAWLVFEALSRRFGEHEGGERPTRRDNWAMGVLNIAVPYAIVYWSERVLPSSLVSVLWAVYPLLMAYAGHTWLGERLHPSHIAGFLLGFAGVVVLFLGDLRALGNEAMFYGVVVLFSPLVHMFGTAYVKLNCAGTSSMHLNAGGMRIGAALLAILALLTERDATWTWNATAIGSILYLALLGTVVTFGVYWWLMRYAPASKISLIAYVIPVIALTLGHLIDDDPVRWTTFAGGGLVLLGVGLVQRRGVPPVSD